MTPLCFACTFFSRIGLLWSILCVILALIIYQEAESVVAKRLMVQTTARSQLLQFEE